MTNDGAVVGGVFGVRRRRIPRVSSLLGVLLLAGLPVSSCGRDAAGGAPLSTTAQEVGMVTGRPFADPPEADLAEGQNITITLTAAGTRFDLAGKQVWGQSYNGGFLAPTIRAQPGAHLAIRLVNHLPVATNLHFHGLHVSPSGDADNPFLCVPAGATFTYHLDIPENHPQGTYWYHSHAMATTCPAPTAAQSMADMPGMAGAPTGSPTSAPFVPGDVENQIFAGLSGALIIGDDRMLLPTPLRHVTAHTIVLKDVQLDTSGHIVRNDDTNSIDSNNPTVRLVNGQLRPVLTMRPGQTQLWRLVNAGADIFYQLQLDGYQFTVIGEDGVPVATTTTAGALLLPPGKRYDVLVTAGPHPGNTTLRTTAYSNGPQGDSYPDTPLAQVDITGQPDASLPPVDGPRPTAPADLASAPIAAHRTVDLTEDEPSAKFFIDGKRFGMGDSSVFDTPAHLGTVEEWTIVNHSGEDHPFHLHISHFQVMSVNGQPWPYTHEQDTIPVPHAVGGVPGRVVIRIPFTDYPGRWMFHCHIAAHEDNGMMSYIDVQP